MLNPERHMIKITIDNFFFLNYLYSLFLIILSFLPQYLHSITEKLANNAVYPNQFSMYFKVLSS